MEYPKVLVISHNPFSDTQNNGKTLSSFFHNWDEKKLAQLFFTTDVIDTDICHNFYRITDVDILKKIFFRKMKLGTNILENDDIKKNNVDKIKLSKNIFYRFIRYLFQKDYSLLWWIRCLSWKIVKPWNDKNLIEWIKNYNPNIIFFQSSSFYVVFDLVINIQKMTNAKLFIETTDDYVTASHSFSLLKYYRAKKMEQKYQEIVNLSSCVFAIGEDMANEYRARFGGNYLVAMNSINIQSKITEYKGQNKIITFLYAGNLGLNRWKNLYELGKCLDRINIKNKIKAKLQICSLNVPSKKVLKKFQETNSIEFIGSLDSTKLTEYRNNSDILVHVESFSKKIIRITRLSISTKIPEYMLSKRCILAIGPKEISSIKYIKNNNIGAVCTDNKSCNWDKAITKLINSENLRIKYITNAFKIANLNHNYEKNHKLVQQKLLEK